MPNRTHTLLPLAALVLTAGAFGQTAIQSALTTRDGANSLAPQPAIPWHRSGTADSISIDDSKRFQTIDGFGHALTGGSAQLLMAMSPAARHALLLELFGSGKDSIHTSYIRVSIGSSDMNDHAFTYDDLPEGATDPALKQFAFGDDEKNVLPVLKEILAIQSNIKILASPWSPPAWMKDNHSLKGGTLQPEMYRTYANYLVHYLQEMQRRGIPITAITPQNEPENPKNLPSLVFTAEQEARFIGEALGPAIRAAGLKTAIIAFDHNCDHPEYPETILRDPVASTFTAGSGFHLYLGSITALTTVHDAFPAKNIYFTEQMVVPDEHHPEDHSIAEPTARVLIGATRNWSRNVLFWNLAADPHNGPHTDNGGCPVCTGAITLDGDHVTRLTAYYTAAHASRFVPPGSVHIASDSASSSLANVAFLTPAGKHVLIVSNTGDTAAHFNILQGEHAAEATLPANAVATYVW